MTEKMDEEKKLANARMKTLDAFGSIIAHDLRNPLSGIRGFANLLERELINNPQLKGMASKIVAGADDLNRMLNDILEYTRPRSPEKNPFDLVKLIKEEIAVIEKEPWQLSLPSDSYIVETDEPLIRGIVKNLVSFAGNIGEFKLALADSEDIAIHMIIKGKTLSNQELEKIYNPHFSSQGPLLEENLSLVKRNTDCLMGNVELISELDSGIEIRINLPRKHGS